MEVYYALLDMIFGLYLAIFLVLFILPGFGEMGREAGASVADFVVSTLRGAIWLVKNSVPRIFLVLFVIGAGVLGYRMSLGLSLDGQMPGQVALAFAWLLGGGAYLLFFTGSWAKPAPWGTQAESLEKIAAAKTAMETRAP